ncbi:MAG: DUF262 domain-containing protein [Gammaproteobacteria bacterium]|nr:MAG: DUF262 domain-containing protein [Gammaproteobacteria bacterium]
MSPNQGTIITEEIENYKGTGVELETFDDDDEESISSPWDPKRIRVDAKVFSVRNMIDMINDGDLQLAPDFQRRQVWTQKQKSRLIESLLLHIPLPAFYFSADDDGKMLVVDGLQRLSAIYDYVKSSKNGYKLDRLEYLQKEVGKKYFKEIEGTRWARRIYNTQILANVIDPQTPSKVKFDIFKRINTGGSPLNAQEIRHCMSKKRSRNFLKQLAASEEFNNATNNNLREHVRMVDREVILRFCAFRIIESIEKDYAPIKTMNSFLTEISRIIDTELSDETLKQLAIEFKRAMLNAQKLFGSHAFRKWLPNSYKSYPINRALFETWGNALADYEWQTLKPYRAAIIKAAREMMLNDNEFLSAISTSTSTASKVVLRFSKVKQVLKDVGL